MRATAKPRELNCTLCNTAFLATHSQAKYCSVACTNQGKRTSWNKYSHANLEDRREHHRKMYQNNAESVLERTAAYTKTDKGKEIRKAVDAKQKLLYPEKYAARQAVLVAKRKGILVPVPCACGEVKVQAHHEDYSKPLEVIWMCKKCHDQETFYKGKMGVTIEDGSVKVFPVAEENA